MKTKVTYNSETKCITKNGDSVGEIELETLERLLSTTGYYDRYKFGNDWLWHFSCDDPISEMIKIDVLQDVINQLNKLLFILKKR